MPLTNEQAVALAIRSIRAEKKKLMNEYGTAPENISTIPVSPGEIARELISGGIEITSEELQHEYSKLMSVSNQKPVSNQTPVLNQKPVSQGIAFGSEKNPLKRVRVTSLEGKIHRTHKNRNNRKNSRKNNRKNSRKIHRKN